MARLDNSAFQDWWKCPTSYEYKFQKGLQRPSMALEVGNRFHQLLEFHYLAPLVDLDIQANPDPEIENLCQSMFEAYRAAYPIEPFDVIATEKRFELDAPGGHKFLGKIDMLVRDRTTGRKSVFETKTESRGSKRNLPTAWAARTQASMYVWAAQRLFDEPIDNIILNVATKPSPKGNVGPSFRRDILERTPAQIDQALEDFAYVADQIDEMRRTGRYPRNTNACVSENGWACDFYNLCHCGHSPELESQLVQVEPFSHLSL